MGCYYKVSDHSIKLTKSYDFIRMTLAISLCTDNDYPYPRLSWLRCPAARSPLQMNCLFLQASLSLDSSFSLRSVPNSDDEAWQKSSGKQQKRHKGILTEHWPPRVLFPIQPLAGRTCHLSGFCSFTCKMRACITGSWCPLLIASHAQDPKGHLVQLSVGRKPPGQEGLVFLALDPTWHEEEQSADKGHSLLVKLLFPTSPVRWNCVRCWGGLGHHGCVWRVPF